MSNLDLAGNLARIVRLISIWAGEDDLHIGLGLHSLNIHLCNCPKWTLPVNGTRRWQRWRRRHWKR